MSERKTIWNQISDAGIKWASEFAPDEPGFITEIKALENKRNFRGVAHHLYRLDPRYSPDFFWSALCNTDLPEPKSMARHLKSLFLLPRHLSKEKPAETELQNRVNSEMNALGLHPMPLRTITKSLDDREMLPPSTQLRSLKWPEAKWDVKQFHQWEAAKERKFLSVFEVGLSLGQSDNQWAMGVIAEDIMEAAPLTEKVLLDVPYSLLRNLGTDMNRCFQWLTVNEAISLDVHPYGNPFLRRLEMITMGAIPIGPRGREVKKSGFRKNVVTEYLVYISPKKDDSVDLNT